MKRIAALVLAAGRSRRMGAANKLLMEIDGAPMVARVTAAALASKAEPVLVVSGHQADAVGEALAGLAITLVHNLNFAEGLSTSLAAGLKALPADIDGVVICLGDMPWISATVIDSLIDGFDGRGIRLPTHRGRRGNPVLWARCYFAEMQSLTGDQGARDLIAKHAEQVDEIECDESVLRDVDYPRDAGPRDAGPRDAGPRDAGRWSGT